MNYNQDLVANMREHCKPHSTDDNDALYPKVASGDDEARQAMIRNNMPLVVSIVDEYLFLHQDFEYLRDDLTSDGFLGLTEAVCNMTTPGFTVRNPTAYLSRAIRHHLFKKSKHSNEQPCDAAKWLSVACGNNTSYVDAENLIAACCESDLDCKIIELRKWRFTLREIADKLGMPVMTVTDAFHAVRDRYRQKSLEN